MLKSTWCFQTARRRNSYQLHKPNMPAQTPAGEVNHDLEAVRDEKCVPLARAILTDLAAGLFPESGAMDYTPLTTQGLEKLLAADANVTTEVPYVYQLVFAGFGIINTAIQAAPTEPIDDARYGRIARQLLTILASANVTLTNKTPDETEMAPVKEQVIALITAEKLTTMEVNYVVGNLIAAFNTAQNHAQGALEANIKRAEEKLFKIEDMSDLSMKGIDEVLKSE